MNREGPQTEEYDPQTAEAFFGSGPFPFNPDRILPKMPGRHGFSVTRTLLATAGFALSLGLMKMVHEAGIAAAVIPLWCMSIGILVDGFRGAMRGIIISVVYPVYCAIWLSIAFFVFWMYVVIHSLIAGNDILW